MCGNPVLDWVVQHGSEAAWAQSSTARARSVKPITHRTPVKAKQAPEPRGSGGLDGLHRSKKEGVGR